MKLQYCTSMSAKCRHESVALFIKQWKQSMVYSAPKGLKPTLFRSHQWSAAISECVWSELLGPVPESLWLLLHNYHPSYPTRRTPTLVMIMLAIHRQAFLHHGIDIVPSRAGKLASWGRCCLLCVRKLSNLSLPRHYCPPIPNEAKFSNRIVLVARTRSANAVSAETKKASSTKRRVALSTSRADEATCSLNCEASTK